MKPLLLTLKNFGPYLDETIDFTKFMDSSLFLISGKTGSGKTTIFDGMSYALFGESSGNIRSSKEVRSIFASDSAVTQVCFTFSHGGYFYEISRRPEQCLLKKRGKGETIHPAKVSLIVKDSAGKEKQELTKKKDVEQFIYELLHLNAKQFSQIVLLPQGELRTFLLTNSEEREKILRKLFGTEIYQQVAEELKSYRKQASQNHFEMEQQLKNNSKQLFWLTQPPIETEVSLQETYQKIDIENQKIEAKQAEVKQKLDGYKQTKRLTEQKIDRLKENMDKKKQLLDEQQQLVKRTDKIEEQRHQLKQLQWAKQHLILIDRLDEQLQQKQQLKATKKEELEKQKIIQYSLQEKQQELKNYQCQQEQMKQLEYAIIHLDYQLPLYQKNEQLIKLYNEQKLLVIQRGKELEDIEAEWEEYQKTIQKLAIVIHEKDDFENEWQQLKQQIENWQEIQQQLKTLKIKQHKLKQQQEELLQLNDLSNELSEQQEKLQKIHQQKKSEWAEIQIEQLSHYLVEGQPCPICGSIEHPKNQLKNHSPKEIEQIEKELVSSEKNFNNNTHQLIQLTAKIKQKKELIKLEQQIFQEEEQVIQQKIKLLMAKSGVQYQIVTNKEIDCLIGNYLDKQTAIKQKLFIIEQKQLETEKLTPKFSLMEKNKNIATDQFLNAKEQLQSIEIEQEIIKRQLDDPKITTDEICKNKQLKENQWQKWSETYKELQMEVSKQEEQLSLIEHTLLHLTKEETRIADYIDNLNQQLRKVLQNQPKEISEEQLRGWLKQLDQIENLILNIQQFDNQMEWLNSQLDEFSKINQQQTENEIKQLQEKAVNFNQFIEKEESMYYQLQEKLQNNRALKKQMYHQLTLLKKQTAEVIALQQLSDGINGSNIKKTSLERYVLQNYLKKVLEVANQHLNLLTSDRYQFELNTQVKSYKNQTGLEIDVYDTMAGTTRSVYTLSGGESFIAALALAISLAEVIQAQAGGIIIDALFIDEGFGSLDEESLEMAITALETIENEGRMIGIISHVSELKTRIPQQLKIKTNGSGQSKVSYQLA